MQRRRACLAKVVSFDIVRELATLRVYILDEVIASPSPPISGKAIMLLLTFRLVGNLGLQNKAESLAILAEIYLYLSMSTQYSRSDGTLAPLITDKASRGL